MTLSNNLDFYRSEIDRLDKALLELLSQRMAISLKIGEYKKAHHLPPLDSNRWRQVLASRVAIGLTQNLPRELIVGIYEIIHRFSLSAQK